MIDYINSPKKILLSAFACRPHAGSEQGVGWRWAIELAAAGHQVVVLTDITRRADIERELDSHPRVNLTIVCYRPRWLKRVPLNSTTAQMLYSAWQYSLLPQARLLHKNHQFDLIIHLTYGVFRHPSFLGFVGPKFIFGPVGGGEDAPWILKNSLPPKEKLKEILRSVLNRIAKFNPMLNLALSRANLILAKTDDTRRALPVSLQSKTYVFPEIGIDTSVETTAVITPRLAHEPLQVLFVGRLLGWKGAHLAIRAIAAVLSNQVPVHLTLVGSGPLLDWLKALAARLGIDDHITWIGQIPQQELFELYRRMHCFLFPSLHDSSGNVVLEALSFGLPVICLDIGGPVTLVTPECASIIKTCSSDEAAVVESLALALMNLYSDEPARIKQSQSAYDKARSMSWKSRVVGALAMTQL